MTAKFFHDSEKQQQKKKGKGEEVEVDIKFRINKRIMERTFYLTTIIVLIGVIAFLMYFQDGCIKPQTAGAVVEDVSIEKAAETKTTNTTKETEKKEPEPAPEPKKEEPKEETVTKPEKTKVDAELVFTESNIETEGDHPSVKVTEVKYKIKNTGMRFVAKVELRWYDKNDENTIKEKVRATDEFIINQDSTSTRTMDTFLPKYLSRLNEEETFVLTLYNSQGNKLLDKKTITYSP